MTVPLEAPSPNPLQSHAVEIALVMQQDESPDGILARKNELSFYERLRFESRLGPGLFGVCLRGIRKEIADVGGPDEFLHLQTTNEAGLPAPDDVLDLVFGEEIPEEPVVISDSTKVFMKETLALQAMVRRALAYESAEPSGELSDPDTGEKIGRSNLGNSNIPVYVVRGQAFASSIFD